ncbi:hypothetical protein PoB_001821100 [Plakobranchus ocellatus]|uniref:Uncharacterized protein n=1 Tax=Plakobranchus ocellatus TaxID=259542 RepID=A0AAV3ZAM1_9GAST|nr:hypothetical protein PoB_001821100 [Plakobranchus ocellatus]
MSHRTVRLITNPHLQSLGTLRLCVEASQNVFSCRPAKDQWLKARSELGDLGEGRGDWKRKEGKLFLLPFLFGVGTEGGVRGKGKGGGGGAGGAKGGGRRSRRRGWKRRRGSRGREEEEEKEEEYDEGDK